MKGKWTKIDWVNKKEQILKWIYDSNNTISKSELCLRLNVRINTLEQNLRKIGIIYEGNQGSRGVRLIENESIFIENSSVNNSRIRQRIIQDNLIEYKCTFCDNKGIWKEKKLKLQLDHINGVRNDNRVENLRWLCPNCHSQTDTYCTKNRMLNKKAYISDDKFLEVLKNNSCIVARSLRELGLSGSGNYERAYKLIAKHNLTESKTHTHRLNKQVYHKQ